MYGTDLRQVSCMVFAQPERAEAFIQHLLHPTFVFDTPAGVVEEGFVERDACIPVPPDGVEDDVNGQRLAAYLYHVVLLRVGGGGLPVSAKRNVCSFSFHTAYNIRYEEMRQEAQPLFQGVHLADYGDVVAQTVGAPRV